MSLHRNKTRIRGQDQLIFMGTGKLVGIQNISINNNFGPGPLTYLGIGNKKTSYIPVSEQYAAVNINSQLINSDPFIGLTGENPINIFILKDTSNISDHYCLISGYLDSYASRYTIGQPASIETSFRFYENAGRINPYSLSSGAFNELNSIPNINYSYLDSGYLISNGGSVNLTLDEYNTNRVTDYSIDLKVNRQPKYNIGSRYLASNSTIYPIDVNCSFVFDAAENESGMKLRDFPSYKKIQNIVLSVNDYISSGSNIHTYRFNDMTLVNESRDIDVNGSTRVSVVYNGKISGPIYSPHFSIYDPTATYVAYRTDGIIGSGTFHNPYDGSTALKLDSYIQSLPAGGTLYFGNGTFQSSGYVPGRYSHNKTGQKFIGQGIDKTVIKVIGMEPNISQFALFSSDYNHFQHYCQYKDFTIDCNMDGQSYNTGYACGGINIQGNYTLIKNVRVKNWGCRLTREVFMLSAGGGGQFSFFKNGTGAIIENCVVDSPNINPLYPNREGASLIHIFGGAYTQDPNNLSGSHHNGIIRNCVADGGNWGGFYSNGIMAYGTNGQTYNNTIKNVSSAFYNDTLRIADITVRNNNVINCDSAFNFNHYLTNASLGTGRFLNNTISLSNTTRWPILMFRFLGNQTYNPANGWNFQYLLVSGNTLKFHSGDRMISGGDYGVSFGSLYNVGTGIIVNNSSSLFEDNDPLFPYQLTTGIGYIASITVSNNRSSITNKLITGAP